MLRLILALVMLVLALPIVGSGESPPAMPQKAVLVTGASTGIGRKTTERLAADGYFVYAGARKDADLEALRYAKFRSRSHDAVIRVFDEAGNVIETHEHTGEFREP